MRQASHVAQLVKNLPAMRESWVRSLGWKDPLEKGKATPSSVLAWRIQSIQTPIQSVQTPIQSMGSQRVGTRLSDFHFHFPVYHPLESSQLCEMNTITLSHFTIKKTQ